MTFFCSFSSCGVKMSTFYDGLPDRKLENAEHAQSLMKNCEKNKSWKVD